MIILRTIYREAKYHDRYSNENQSLSELYCDDRCANWCPYSRDRDQYNTMWLSICGFVRWFLSKFDLTSSPLFGLLHSLLTSSFPRRRELNRFLVYVPYTMSLWKIKKIKIN